jgi:hypothetical protein
MQSAQELMKKYPTKRLMVDLQFAKLYIAGKKENNENAESEQIKKLDRVQTKSQRSMSRQGLNQDFGMFKRNPS